MNKADQIQEWLRTHFIIISISSFRPNNKVIWDSRVNVMFIKHAWSEESPYGIQLIDLSIKSQIK